jgi:hypothetical protein
MLAGLSAQEQGADLHAAQAQIACVHAVNILQTLNVVYRTR